MYKGILLIIVVLLVYSCDGKTSVKEKKMINKGQTYNINPIIDTLTNMNSLFDIKKIRLKMKHSKRILGAIKHAYVHIDGNMYLLDNDANIFKFDKNGNYLESMSKVGRGPDEYLDFDKFTLDSNENIYIDDWRQLKILKLDDEFNFINDRYKDRAVPFVQMEIFGNKLYCFHPFSFDASILVYDKKTLKFIKKMGQVDLLKKKYRTSLHCGSLVIVNDDLLFYVLPNYYQIFKIQNGQESKLLTKAAGHFKQVSKPIKNPFQDINKQSSSFRLFKEDNYFFLITAPAKNTFKYVKNRKYPTDIINLKGEILKEAVFFYNIKAIPIKYAPKKYISFGYDEDIKNGQEIFEPYVLLLNYKY